jgi:type IV pilus assembly protein PilV
MIGEPSTKNKIECASHGFTLIEVMIALAIFSFGILGIYSLQISAIKGNSAARNRTQAIAWAANRAEILLNTPYAVIAGGQETRGIYNIQWTAPQVDINNDGVDDARNIQINVSWNELGGSKRTRLDFTSIQD